MTKEISREKKELIERIGVFQEKSGMQGVPARIMALLLLSDDPLLTFDEIREHLKISKSATSNALNMLLSTGRIDYMTKPGERKRFFKSKVEKWKDVLVTELEKTVHFRELMEEVIELRTNKSTEFNHKIKEVINFLQYLEAELPKIIENWEKQREG